MGHRSLLHNRLPFLCWVENLLDPDDNEEFPMVKVVVDGYCYSTYIFKLYFSVFVIQLF
jgi:hypothetical protein